MLNIKQIEIVQFKIPLAKPFVTSFGSVTRRDVILVALHDDDGAVGWGEAPVLSLPLYNPEIPESVVALLSRVVAPVLKDKTFADPDAVHDALAFIRGNEFAKSAVVMAAYDLYGKKLNKRLIDLLGGEKERLTVSATVSIHPTVDATLAEAQGYYDRGIRQLKLKIKPGFDVAYARAMRERFPDAALTLDANASYVLSDETIRTFRTCDALNLSCLEQPLQPFDLIDHAKLRKAIRTPIALDESVESVYDTEKALELDSCRLVNIKIARVGGLVEALRINALCAERNIPTWIGGMLESPVGFYANLALATVENFDRPVDFLGAISYVEGFEEFFAVKPYAISGESLALNITQPGLGLELDWERLDAYRTQTVAS
jgi:O-succinylbenzoate synthase